MVQSTVTPVADTFTTSITGTDFSTDMSSRVFLATDQIYNSLPLFEGTLNTITDTLISATFTNVPAGTYTLFVEIANAGFASPSTSSADDVIIDLSGTTTNIVSSFLGGNSLTLNGYGFGSETVVKVCGKVCKVLDSTTDLSYTSVKCDTPAIISESTNTAYKISKVGLIT